MPARASVSVARPLASTGSWWISVPGPFGPEPDPGVRAPCRPVRQPRRPPVGPVRAVDPPRRDRPSGEMGLAHRTPCPVGASRRLASRSSTGLMAPASLAAIASSASRARSQVGAPRELPGGRPGRALRCVLGDPAASSATVGAPERSGEDGQESQPTPNTFKVNYSYERVYISVSADGSLTARSSGHGGGGQRRRASRAFPLVSGRLWSPIGPHRRGVSRVGACQRR